MSIRLNGIFLKFLGYFIMFILIPVVTLGTLSYIVFSNFVQQEIRSFNQVILHKTSEIVEQKAAEIQNMMYQTVLQVQVKDNDAQKKQQVKELLARIRNSNKFIYDVYVYYGNTQQIIRAEGQYEADYFFRNVYQYKEMNGNQWRKVLSERNNFSVIPTQKVSVLEGSEVNLVTFLTAFPLYDDAIEGNLVVVLEEEKLSSIMNSLNQQSGQSGFVITDSNMKPISSSDKSLLVPMDSLSHTTIYQKLLHNWNDREQNFKTTLEGKNFSVSYIDSQLMDWHYIVFTSLDKMDRQASYIRTLTLVFCLILIGIGIYVAIRLSRNLSRPIYDIMNLFQEAVLVQERSNKDKNEFQYIFQHINFVIDNNKKLQVSAQKQHMLLRDYYIKSLLLGDSANANEPNDELEPILQYPLHTAIVIHSDCFNEESNYAHDNWKNRLMHVIERMMNQENQISGLLTSMGESNISILLNFLDEDMFMDEIRQITECIAHEVDKSGQRISIGIGNVYNSLQYVNKAYEEALMALNFRDLNSTIQFIRYGEAQSIMNTQSNVYTTELEKKLTSHIMMGEAEKVQVLLEDLFTRSFADKAIYRILLDCRQALLDTLNKLVTKHQIRKGNISFQELLHPPEIEQVGVIETKDFIIHAFTELAHHFKSNAETSNAKLMEDIIAFIQQRYDQALSLDIISDAFQLNPKNLSRYFKTHLGINFVDYLNHLRIEKAKELLANDPDLKINQVAEKTGIPNMNSFIWTFKKVEGITPGQFKSLIRSDNEDTNQL
ncbi:helix-turn-helix domain-containing protein [Paenibacillus agricola]|uniref:Helix-turn-helix domain-containing protein n=1 Tax=Paenibacillus agricola TaxID=2716264 RepID=A0ABX0J176_9BACL|nr:helix-turn-helix domain-containing protein [Paenibacillus agricola]NHN29867.1 helix-turn-helix domain-containing protein [Paenibacillus agricola]